MNKKFEYIDDNPGSYFGMLVENWENLNEDEKKFRNWIEKKVGKQMSNMKPTKVGYRHGRPCYSVDFIDGTSDDYFIDFDKKEIEKCESLKEDKFVPQDKMSKKAQKELNDKKRGTWGNTNPVTKVQPNKKAYDRKRNSKVVDESKKLNESSDGWDEDKLSDLSYILDKLANLQYEINNCVKGAYSHCTSYSELGEYIKDLGSELMDIADDVSEYVEEDDEEDLDESKKLNEYRIASSNTDERIKRIISEFNRIQDKLNYYSDKGVKGYNSSLRSYMSRWLDNRIDARDISRDDKKAIMNATYTSTFDALKQLSDLQLTCLEKIIKDRTDALKRMAKNYKEVKAEDKIKPIKDKLISMKKEIEDKNKQMYWAQHYGDDEQGDWDTSDRLENEIHSLVDEIRKIVVKYPELTSIVEDILNEW